MTIQDHSNKPPNKEDLPSAKCTTCGRPRERHTNDEVKECKIGKYANSGEMAGTRHTRK